MRARTHTHTHSYTVYIVVCVYPKCCGESTSFPMEAFLPHKKAKQSEKYRRHMPTHCKLQITATVNVCVAFLTIQSQKTHLKYFATTIKPYTRALEKALISQSIIISGSLKALVHSGPS